MDSALYTYPPMHSYLDQTTMLSLLAILVAIFALWWNYKREVAAQQRNMHQLINMLLGFIILIAMGTGTFSWLTSKRIQAIEVYQNRIETNEGVIFVDKIKRVYFEQSVPQTPFKLNELGDSTLLLVIEDIDPKKTAHVFSEENYPIQQMMDDLRPWLKKATGGE